MSVMRVRRSSHPPSFNPQDKMVESIHHLTPEGLDHFDDESVRNNTQSLASAQRNSEGQTVMITSAIIVSVIVLIIIMVVALLIRRKTKQRKLREQRAREAVDLCIDRAKFGV